VSGSQLPCPRPTNKGAIFVNTSLAFGKSSGSHLGSSHLGSSPSPKSGSTSSLCSGHTGCPMHCVGKCCLPHSCLGRIGRVWRRCGRDANEQTEQGTDGGGEQGKAGGEAQLFGHQSIGDVAHPRINEAGDDDQEQPSRIQSETAPNSVSEHPIAESSQANGTPFRLLRLSASNLRAPLCGRTLQGAGIRKRERRWRHRSWAPASKPKFAAKDEGQQ
jgi:hypothetical protein